MEWITIKEYCQNRLNELRIENDNDKSDTETAKLRGMIETIKEILSLEESEQVIEIADQTYIK